MAKTRQKKEKDVLDQLLDNIDFRGLTQDEVVGKDGLIKQLTGRILQRALEAEMSEHLGYEKNSNAGDNQAVMGMAKKRCFWKTKARRSRSPATALERSSR